MDPKVKIRVNASLYVRLSGRLTHLPYLLSISVSMAVKIFDKLYEGSRALSSIYVVKIT